MLVRLKKKKEKLFDDNICTCKMNWGKYKQIEKVNKMVRLKERHTTGILTVELVEIPIANVNKSI